MELKVKIRKKLSSFVLGADFETDIPMALLGASGSGKSMTLKCIAGIEKPDSGTIILNGRTLFDSDRRINLSPQKRNVGYLFQNYALFPNMTVRKNIEVGIKRKDYDAGAIIKDFYLEDVENKYPHEISGGQQQRTALARIIASQPDILLLDEPFSAIDTHLRWQLEMTTSDIIKKFGSLYLMVTHDRGEACRNCGNICIIDNGKTEGVVDRETFIQKPSSVGAARILGIINIFEFKNVDKEGNIFVPQLNTVLKISGSAENYKYIGIREQLIDFNGNENKIDCVVERVIYDIFSTIIILRPVSGGNGILRVEVKGDILPEIYTGKCLSINIRPENILLLK